MPGDRSGSRGFREQMGLAIPPEAAAPVTDNARADVQGHRARLRQRFLQAGPMGVADYEMLELVLFRAIPQRDVKSLAKRLLATFGDFNAAVSAPPARLAEVQGIGPAVICELKIVEAAAHRLWTSTSTMATAPRGSSMPAMTC